MTGNSCNLNNGMPHKDKDGYSPEETRREFLYLTTAGFGVVAVASTDDVGHSRSIRHF